MQRNNFEFKRIAHRGASGEAPENTIPALRLAVEKYRVDGVEIDLRLSRDGVPVVFHDVTLERTTDGAGPLKRCSLEELKARDAGFRFDPEGKGAFPYRGKGVAIPTLEEVLVQFPETSFCLEVKEREIESVGKILAIVRRIPRKASLVIGSFHGKVARGLRRSSPPSLESILSEGEVIRAYLSFRLGFKKFSAPSRLAFLPVKRGKVRLDNPKWISFLRESGIRIFYWTVNEISEMERLLKAGADGILTDYPGRLNDLLERKGQG